MKCIITLLLSLQFAWALRLPDIDGDYQSLSEDAFYSQLLDGINDYQDSVVDELNMSGSKKYRLDRFDLQFGLSASGDFAVITAGGSSAVEFIWQRNLKEGDAGDDIDEDVIDGEDITLDLSTTEEEITQALLTQTKKVFRVVKLKRRARKKLLRRLRKDAQKIRSVIADLVLMPQIGEWYIGGFFQNYHFKKGFSLGVFGINKDVRIRYRFKIQKVPMLGHEESSLNSRQKRLGSLMKKFNQMGSSSSSIHNQFLLKRVWSIHNYNFEVDLEVLKLGAGRGLQIEFKRLIPTPTAHEQRIPDGLGFKMINSFNNRFVGWFDGITILDPADELSLHQIRLKYTGDLELGFKLLTLGKSKTMEFHYKR